MFIEKILSPVNIKKGFNKDSTGKEGFNTIFGDSIQATKIDEISIKFDLGINTNLLTSTSSNGGLVSESEAKAIVSTGTQSNGYSFLSSRNNIRYRPGHEIYAYFTASFHNYQGDKELNIGLFDGNNGFLIGFSNGLFRIERRYNGTKYTVNREDFNKDKLDGNGPSNFLLNEGTINIFRITLGYLGISPIVFQIYGGNDKGWITFHIIDLTNNSEDLTIMNPNLPISIEVKNNGATTNGYIQSGSWNGGYYNGTYQSKVGDIPHGYNSGVGTNLIGTGNENSVIFKLKTVYNGKENKTKVKLVHSQYASTATGDIIKVQIIANPTSIGGVLVGNLVFTDIEADSTVQYKESGGVVSGGTILFTAYLMGGGSGSGATKGNESVDSDEIGLIGNPGDYFEVCYERVTGTGAYKSLCTLNWLELF